MILSTVASIFYTQVFFSCFTGFLIRLVDSLWKGEIMSDIENLWKGILENLKETVSRSCIETWIMQLELKSVDDNRLIFIAPNTFIKNIIKKSYKDSIEKSAKLIDPGIISAEFFCPSDNYEYRQNVKNYIEHEAINPNLNPYYTFNKFIPGEENLYLFEHAKRVSEFPGEVYNPFFIYGNTGLGKTHLLNSIGNAILKNDPYKKVLYVTSEEYTNDFINGLQDKEAEKFRRKYRDLDCLILDDIQFLAEKGLTQEEFFHTFNALFAGKKQIILAADRTPVEIKNFQDRLISRFVSGLIIGIKEPNLETRIAILRSKAKDQNLEEAEEGVFEYVAKRVQNNVRQLEGALMSMKALLDGSQKISREIAVKALEDIYKSYNREISIDMIKKEVASYFSISLDELNSRKKSNNIAYPRQIAMYLARVLTDISYPKIGEAFGGKDHSTVIYAFDKINERRNFDENLKVALSDIEEKIRKS